MDNKNNSLLEEMAAAPAATVIVGTFFLLILYFILDFYFFTSEYYAGTPPYALMVACGIVGLVLVFLVLRHLEPDREDGAVYAILFGLGVGLASYALLPRISIALDSGEVENYTYVLNDSYQWEPGENKELPNLDLYMRSSEWWQQFEPGDSYNFQLRKGGLSIWLVNMSPIYTEQKKYYDCDGVLSCMRK